MPAVVEALPGSPACQQVLQPVGHVAAVQRCPDHRGEDEVPRHPAAGREDPVRVLPPPVVVQGGDDARRDGRHAAASRRLQLDDGALPVDALHRVADREHVGLQIDVHPAQP
ncbi:MAG TPA: hypothetical protein VGR16_13770 [Thermomicrobiales bacterium]|nr:hypothetical protein [Thermomicrobiales bacterium]